MSKLLYGDSAARAVSGRIAAPQSTLALLKALAPEQREDGMRATVLADGSSWRFNASSALTGDDILVAAPSSGTGRWLRAEGVALLKIPFTFATSDAAVLLTIPAGCILSLHNFAWDIDTGMTGGSSSAIGVSSSNHTGHTTKGDLLGGAAGDVAATLVASTADYTAGTIGAAFHTVANRRPAMKAADTLRFDRITSAFTAGAGSVLVFCTIDQNLGA
jgi:hypothetical protein